MKLAQSVSEKIDIGDIGNQPAVVNWPYKNIGKFTANLVIAAMILGGLITFILLVWGGVRYLTAQGDKEQVESARNTITYALIGLVIVIGSYAIIKLIEAFFGVNILESRFPTP